ncbi:NTP transferase domain-containing protein [Schleiferiaceae bacterium]|nr:NTP transferase domain-containing protein [Schleiferiaceae bacterium]
MIDVILLLAGSGNRMGKLTKTCHKSLLGINRHDSFLSRILHQLNEFQVNTVSTVLGYRHQDVQNVLELYQLNFDVVYNFNYERDTNIESMLLALSRLSGNYPVLVIEGDVIMDDYTIYDMYQKTMDDTTRYFTRGRFNSSQYGGIVKGMNSRVEEVKIVASKKSEDSGAYKMSGVMSFSRAFLSRYKERLESISNEESSYYYLEPWIRGEFINETYFSDYPNQFLDSCNTPEDYELLKKKFRQIYSEEKSYELVEVKSLKPIEDFISERVPIIKKEIFSSGFWTKPIIIDSQDHLIMDGHHRFEIAKQIGLKMVPAVILDYSKVQIWSLRNDVEVNHELVRAKAIRKDIYPNKTVKHDFRFKLPQMRIELNSLK